MTLDQLQPLAHQSVHDQGQETHHRMRPDALWQGNEFFKNDFNFF
jgi:hypothetical protein